MRKERSRLERRVSPRLPQARLRRWISRGSYSVIVFRERSGQGWLAGADRWGGQRIVFGGTVEAMPNKRGGDELDQSFHLGLLVARKRWAGRGQLLRVKFRYPPRGCLAQPDRGKSPLMFHPLQGDTLPFKGQRKVTSSVQLPPVFLVRAPFFLRVWVLRMLKVLLYIGPVKREPQLIVA